ncbi:MAG: glycosyltransferase family 2 protein [bacterium]|nr:glycosyltransferase family 2 protein [bacterium]
MNTPYYLKVGRASDLKDKKERIIYRFFEILPGAISWFTIFLAILLSWLRPVWISISIIAFVIYWMFRTIYFSFHLRASFQQMKKNEKIDWLEKIKSFPKQKEIYHLVVLPMYKESGKILKEALRSLISSDWPKEKMLIVLTCEEGGNKTAAIEAEKEFSDKFFRFLLTFHPQNLPDEILGKGANESWGTKKAKDLIIDPLSIPYENIIVSSFDADTCVFPKYFSCLTYYYLFQKNPTRCSFQPVPLFVNNIWQAPPISRIFAFSATFWQMMCQERPEKLITFSSHSMSFRALVDVGFRQANAVSDDSRIFWQCFLYYDGDYKVVPLYYPIAMDANAASSFFRTMKNVYKQQRRWAYGAGDVPYFLFGFLKNPKIPFLKKFSLGFNIFEGHWSWATNSILIFLLGWLPLWLGSKEFGQSLLAYNLPSFVSRVLTIGMLGLIGSVYFSVLLLPPRPFGLGKKKYLFFILEWFLLPLIMIFFTSLPALEAQTRLMLGKYMGFWPTEKFRKK